MSKAAMYDKIYGSRVNTDTYSKLPHDNDALIGEKFWKNFSFLALQSSS